MTATYHATRYGPDAWLIHFASLACETSWQISRFLVASIAANPPPFLAEWTLAPTSILLEFQPGHAPRHAPQFGNEFQPCATSDRPIISIPVAYSGPDLGRVAQHANLSIREVIQLHSQVIYLVHALGFAPGFAYLGGLPEILHTPRLDAPRPCIPAGSVGIGGPQTGIYPLATPGGWNIIGSTAVTLFDPTLPMEQAFLLHPGDRIQFHSHE